MAQIFFKKQNRKPSTWATLGLVTLLFAGIGFIIAGPLFQIGSIKNLWQADTAFDFRIRLVTVGLGLVTLGSLFTMLGILHTLTSPRVRLSWRGALAILLAIGLGWPMGQAYRRTHEAFLNADISTNPQNPPAFKALKAPAPEPETQAATAAAIQSPFVSYISTMSPASTTARALQVAKKLKWRIVASDVTTGRIEAIGEDRWFGVQSLIVIRILPHTGGSILDIRAVSEMGDGGWGLNAALIRQFLDIMAA
ncbi:DUF1499 domain-containing protein [Kordiimonas marina]|uniref:DUF1499 domain-containing protein n=1 Tax=Kordiimonas marina TaxID=2872312 RepID=UPI001FF3D47E|nr:DUF1499 domain-containing protein [Kordiimonas marina]MCJ9427447.1 DUF1499 domain-containing protein [Kordiimonas marina]